MFLRYRPATIYDLVECQYCLRDSFAYGEEDLSLLRTFWQELMASGAGHGAVIEDISVPKGERIVWFCFKVFASDDQVENYFRKSAPPLLGRSLLERYRCGTQMPLLTGEQLRRENMPGGRGVNMIVLNSGFPKKVLETPGAMEMIGDKAVDFNYYFSAGYHLNSLMLEMYDDFQYAWGDGAGYRFYTDYADFYEFNKAPLPPKGQSPQLWGTNAAEVWRRVGTVASMVFKYTPPRFFFRPVEQELLLWAMANATDAELAEALNLSPNTLKKRWKNVYERVAEVDPSLFSHLKESGTGEKGERGGEKRRHLLNYLKHHLEELRPVEPHVTTAPEELVHSAATR